MGQSLSQHTGQGQGLSAGSMSGLGLNSYARGASAASNGTRPNTGLSTNGGKESGFRNRPAPSDGDASALPQVSSFITDHSRICHRQCLFLNKCFFIT